MQLTMRSATTLYSNATIHVVSPNAASRAPTPTTSYSGAGWVNWTYTVTESGLELIMTERAFLYTAVPSTGNGKWTDLDNPVQRRTDW